jgi:hypothetical protein
LPEELVGRGSFETSSSRIEGLNEPMDADKLDQPVFSRIAGGHQEELAPILLLWVSTTLC